MSNLYPFVETVASGAADDAIVDQIDIGGPALMRAAAKNHANVAIVDEPRELPADPQGLSIGGTTLAQRRRLAAEAFAHTAAYDAAVAAWFSKWTPAASQEHEPQEHSEVTDTITIEAQLKQSLRYGENAHQPAALYVLPEGHGIAQATQLHGKEMSYNNFVDADAALRAAYDFDEPAVAIIKHANPCGIAVAAAPGIPSRPRTPARTRATRSRRSAA